MQRHALLEIEVLALIHENMNHYTTVSLGGKCVRLDRLICCQVVLLPKCSRGFLHRLFRDM